VTQSSLVEVLIVSIFMVEVKAEESRVAYPSTLRMDAIPSSETLVNYYQITPLHVLD
jgi:hypothetical protein